MSRRGMNGGDSTKANKKVQIVFGTWMLNRVPLGWSRTAASGRRGGP